MVYLNEFYMQITKNVLPCIIDVQQGEKKSFLSTG